MRIVEAGRVMDPTKGRRIHAQHDDEDRALCGATVGATVAEVHDLAVGQVDCRRCLARLRDSGLLPMTPHALARRVGS